MDNVLCYTQTGDRQSNVTLLFLHGSTMTKEGLLPLAQEFDAYNCLTFDLTAHGASKGPMPADVTDIAADVERSVEALKQTGVIHGKLAAIGYSMGGTICCELALRKRIAPDGIVFLSSGADLNHYTPAIDELKAISPQEFRTVDILDALFGTLADDAQRADIKRLFADTRAMDTVGYNDLMMSNAYDSLARAEEIACPVLIIHGCEDKIILPEAAAATWKSIPGSQLFMVPYAGHGLLYEDTAAVCGQIKRFVQKL